MARGEDGVKTFLLVHESDRSIATVITLIAGANEVTACTMPGTIIEANILL
jgi:hypothetical protein